MPIDTPAWVRDAVFYQIFPDRFARSARVRRAGPLEPWDAPPTVHGFKGGDLLGIAERLDELADLGVTALYLNPIFARPRTTATTPTTTSTVDPLLGGDAALRELLDGPTSAACGSILDGVFNHCGRGFWPFHHVLENGAASPYRDWFHLDPAVLAGDAAAERLPGARHGRRRARRSATGPGGACRPCPSSTPTIRRSASTCSASAEHWLRFGIDGWRLDVPGEIDDRAFWQEFRQPLPRRRTARPTSSARSGTRRRSGSRATGSTRR